VEPRGACTDRVIGRDKEVLEFIARYGVVPRDAVAHWAEIPERPTQERERTLALAGLIEVSASLPGAEPLAIATRAGLVACGRSELPVARTGPSGARHQAACARLGARLEREGIQLLTERELRAEERAWGRRQYSVRTGARVHRPDLIRVGELTVPIEVELSSSPQRRLERIVRAWRRAVRAGRFDRVHYYCAPGALPCVGQAVDGALAAGEVGIEPLAAEDLGAAPRFE
jgi:hypothetical protein